MPGNHNFEGKSLFYWVFARYRLIQTLLTFLILIAIFLRVFPLEMQKRIVNFAIGMKSLNKLLVYCLLYLGAILFSGLVKYMVNATTNYIGQKILYEIRYKLFNHIIKLPLQFFRKTPPGMVISFIIGELSSIGEFLGGALAIPLINILSLLSFAAYMFYLNPLLAVVSFSIYPFEVIIIPLLQKKFNKLNRERIDITRSASNFVGEIISGIHEIHSNASYEMETSRFRQLARKLFMVRYRMANIKYLIKFSNNLFQNLGPFILFLLGGYLSIKGRLDLGALVAFLSAYEKLYDPWKELIEYYQSYQDANVRYRRILEYFNYKYNFRMVPENRAPYDLEGNVNMQHVSFIADESIKIMDDISLTIEKGRHVAIVGFSGSGKSTLVMILAQLYDYHEGSVLLDNLELKELTKADISINIGYIAQFPFIFKGTIWENISYGYDAKNNIRRYYNENQSHTTGIQLDRSEIIRAIEQVGLEEDIIYLGLNATLSKSEQDLASKILELRKAFFIRENYEIRSLIEHFDYNSYLFYQPLSVNLAFGFSLVEMAEEEILVSRPDILHILNRLGLLTPLLIIGNTILSSTLEIYNQGLKDDFFFKITPLRLDEIESYRNARSQNYDVNTLKDREKLFLLKIALRYNPSRHSIVSIPKPFTEYIVRCRKPFKDAINNGNEQKLCMINENSFCWKHTIFQNIIFGSLKHDMPNAEDKIKEEIIRLINDLKARDMILIRGLDFDVGSEGGLLSGGQKQKIAIARTLLKNPKILIMDEATSGLDNKSQTKIQQLIKNLKGKCTIFSVVHRLETVKDYDFILVMKAGRIVEAGTYEELISKKGQFYELLRGF